MKKIRQISLVSIGLICFIFYGFYFLQISNAQTTPLTIPEVFKYLNTQVPTDQFKSKDEIISFLIREIDNRKVTNPLTPDIENIFRQIGATDALIEAIGKNNPTSPISTPTPTPISTPTSNIVLAPFSISDIKAELQKLAPDASQADLITQIELRKVAGTLSEGLEAVLRNTRATDTLIEAIKKNPVGSPTPVPKMITPSPSTVSPTPEATPTSVVNATNKLPEIENLLGIKFVLIKAGSFMMGSDEFDSDEKPIRQVNFKTDFYFGKYEVTQEEYEKLSETNPSYFKNCPRCPVEQISWDDAQAFIKKLNDRNDDFTYSLPSEAEWEYVAKAGKTTKFSFGNDLGSAQANFNGASPFGTAPKDKFLKKTVEVGLYPPNDWGVYDMHGNVWEWCEDAYAASYAGFNNTGSANLTGNSEQKVLRGGSCYSNGSDLRSANRNFDAPGNKSNDYGFRVVARPKNS